MIQHDLFTDDLSQKRVLVSLSGGINSMAVLCYLATEYPSEHRPHQLFIFYAHLTEHSPDTFRFVKDGIRYARRQFKCVTWKITRGSVLRFFEHEKMIPHPILSPCSEHLKFLPIQAFVKEHDIDIDLLGYIRTEKNRIRRQRERGAQGKSYPIAHLSDEDCFHLVDREIGWHPAIYDIRDEWGNRVFKHNNCLPCKNMQGTLDKTRISGEYVQVAKYYPEALRRAQELAGKLSAYWGRKADFDGYCHYCEV